MKHKARIIDDEKNARAAIRGVIETNIDSIQIIAEAKDLPEAVKLIH